MVRKKESFKPDSFGIQVKMSPEKIITEAMGQIEGGLSDYSLMHFDFSVV